MYIAGIKKGGTAMIHKVLSSHPDIAFPNAEVHFFDNHHEEGLEWYLNQLPWPQHKGQLIGDTTPNYFGPPRNAAPEDIINVNIFLSLLYLKIMIVMIFIIFFKKIS